MCKSLATLQELVQDPSGVMVLKCELAFLAEKADRMLILTDVLQSRKPCTLKVCDVLEDLQLDLTCHESLTRESCSKYVDHVYSDIFVKTNALCI